MITLKKGRTQVLDTVDEEEKATPEVDGSDVAMIVVPGGFKPPTEERIVAGVPTYRYST